MRGDITYQAQTITMGDKMRPKVYSILLSLTKQPFPANDLQ